LSSVQSINLFRPHFVYIISDMLSPRGQNEAKILASASVSASKLWPRPRSWPQTFGLGLASVCSRRTSWAAKKKSTDQYVCTLLCRLREITSHYDRRYL